MRLEPVTGPLITVGCVRCNKSIATGTVPYTSEFTGKAAQLDVVYVDVDSTPQNYYCRPCADEMYPAPGAPAAARFATGGF